MKLNYFFRLYLIVIALFVNGLFSSCFDNHLFSQTNEQNQNIRSVVTINTDKILRILEDNPIGLNHNFYLDADSATHANIPIAKAIKTLGVKYLRYPGGDESDEYLFAYPPYDKVKPHPTRTGKNSSIGRSMFMNPETGSDYLYPPLDFDEFMKICKSCGCEPIVVVAADTRNHPCPEGVTSATREEFLRNAVEWVRYANVKKKYGVKYWMIGNECWHNNVTKYYSVQDYISDIRTFSDSMKKVDPTIQIIANTNFKAFTKALLQGASDKVDMLCISNYPSYGLTNYQDWASGKFDMAAPFKEIAEYVREYAPDKKKNMKIIVAEYGAFDFSNSGWGSNNDMGHAMCDFDILGNLILQNQIPINCFWTTRWTYNSDKSGFNALNDNNQLLPAGYALQFWAQHLFPEIIEASSSSSQLKVYSSCNKTKDAYVYIMNKGEKEVQIKLRNRNEDIKDAACVACMYGTSAEDFFPTVNLNVTQVKDMAILPPYSINVYKVKIP